MSLEAWPWQRCDQTKGDGYPLNPPPLARSACIRDSGCVLVFGSCYQTGVCPKDFPDRSMHHPRVFVGERKRIKTRDTQTTTRRNSTLAALPPKVCTANLCNPNKKKKRYIGKEMKKNQKSGWADSKTRHLKNYVVVVFASQHVRRPIGSFVFLVYPLGFLCLPALLHLRIGRRIVSLFLVGHLCAMMISCPVEVGIVEYSRHG